MRGREQASGVRGGIDLLQMTESGLQQQPQQHGRADQQAEVHEPLASRATQQGEAAQQEVFRLRDEAWELQDGRVFRGGCRRFRCAAFLGGFLARDDGGIGVADVLLGGGEFLAGAAELERGVVGVAVTHPGVAPALGGAFGEARIDLVIRGDGEVMRQGLRGAVVGDVALMQHERGVVGGEV